MGAQDLEISEVASIADATGDQLTFVTEEKYVLQANDSQAAGFVTFRKLDTPKPQIIIKNPRKALAVILAALYEPPYQNATGISPNAAIADQVVIPATSFVGAFVTIGTGCKIGENVRLIGNSHIGRDCVIKDGTLIYPNVTLYDNTVIGERVIIHSGCSIGADGFGYAQERETLIKIPHIGRTVIEDDVEIGANTCIDRGCLGDTLIGKGTKIDNLVHIAHNCQVGPNCGIAGQTGFSGGVKMGQQVMVAGQVGFNGHISIGDFSMILGRASVTKNTAQGAILSGYPAQNHKKEILEQAIMKRLVKHAAALFALIKHQPNQEPKS